MDTPLLKDGQLPEEPKPYRPRYMPSRDVLRLATAVVVCISSVFAWARTHESHPLVVSAPVITPVVNVPIAAPGTTIGGDIIKGQLCRDERRHLPNRGAWQCVGLQPIPAGVKVHDPQNESTNCTHRQLETDDHWTCFTRIPVPNLFLHYPSDGPVLYVGDGGADVLGPRPTDRSICAEEMRDKLTWGVWTCTDWKNVPPDQRWVQVIDPGGPCAQREADNETGIWYCIRST